MFRTLVLSLVLICLPGFALAQVEFWKSEWPRTDFSKTSVPFLEIMSGGPPKDGIPAVDDPVLLPVSSETRLSDREAVIALEIQGQTPRAYPIRYLTWHEIVNDRIGGQPVSITFCPLCNSAIVFDGRLGGRELTFGVSGKLRNSDMVMYDRQTESWWQQAIGTGILGDYTGVELTSLPSWMESWEMFKARNPDGLVMDQPKSSRPYGRNPYVGYDGSARPFLYNGEMPPFGIAPLMRVVAVGKRAWTLERLTKEGEIREQGLVISWTAGQASALDSADISKGRDVGSIRVRDASGRDVVHDVMFAFAFHAFHPDGEWMREAE
jgi:hypothetical protein